MLRSTRCLTGLLVAILTIGVPDPELIRHRRRYRQYILARNRLDQIKLILIVCFREFGLGVLTSVDAGCEKEKCALRRTISKGPASTC